MHHTLVFSNILFSSIYWLVLYEEHTPPIKHLLECFIGKSNKIHLFFNYWYKVKSIFRGVRVKDYSFSGLLLFSNVFNGKMYDTDAKKNPRINS